MTKKRRRRGEERKAVNAMVSIKAYSELCVMAGPRSFGETLDELILKRRTKSSELTLPTSHDGKKAATFNSSS
jgi:predicted CopG family antitoxin